MTAFGAVLFIIGALGLAVLLGVIPLGSLRIGEAQGFLLIIGSAGALIVGLVLIAAGVFVR